jgi:hypothetical protein
MEGDVVALVRRSQWIKLLERLRCGQENNENTLTAV